MKSINYCLLIALILSGESCTEVKPRQRGNLALSQMALTTDALEFGLRQHIAFGKEAGAGGYGGSGGGCGCNLNLSTMQPLCKIS